jgi:SAM-dependent methyltransferase
MQSALAQRDTDFFSGEPFARLDDENDTQFYATPRLVQHLDAVARRHIENCYDSHLLPGMGVLDLMSSWVSHLPPRRDISVVGLGMNEEELKRNTRLNGYVVHDLNRSPALGFESNAFDLVICTTSIEYLINPFDVFKEIARCLKPGGKFVITFSDRWFPPKAIKLWMELHSFERVALVVDYFKQSRWYENIETLSMLHYPRPQDDKYSGQLAFSDPVFAVWASVRKN